MDRPNDTTTPAGDGQIAYLAYHDQLTGLSNRTLLGDCLREALTTARTEGTALALLYIDLNDFKLVNDSLGHAAGDRLLAQVADRLRRVTRPEDVLARQGGDEFILMIPGIRGEAASPERTARVAAEGCARRIAAELQEPFAVGDAVFLVDASVGISLFPFDAEDDETLHMHADAAMYDAKAAGNGWGIYQAGRADPLAKLSLAARMKQGLRDGEFELHYQPIFDLAAGRVLGVEALARWRDPERGLVPPLEFIPVAEKTGLIDALGDWVLEELCRQARAWQDEGLTPGLGINVSPRQLRRPGFAVSFAGVIGHHDLDPSRFVVELTESAWTLDASRTAPVIGALRDLGLTLGLDDFGAGYSSLGRLRSLPFGVLKIDRAFMEGLPEDPQATAIVSAILQLAEACGVDVVAEGIETEGQLGFLVEHGCLLGQGFHLARPAPAEDVTPLLREALLESRGGRRADRAAAA